MREYTAEDGLKLLGFLDILPYITREELEVFKDRWSLMYWISSKDLILTVYYLYTASLPVFTIPDEKEGKKVYHKRLERFEERAREKHLYYFLWQGLSIDDIIDDDNEDMTIH